MTFAEEMEAALRKREEESSKGMAARRAQQIRNCDLTKTWLAELGFVTVVGDMQTNVDFKVGRVDFRCNIAPESVVGYVVRLGGSGFHDRAYSCKDALRVSIMLALGLAEDTEPKES
jgi:hypothetical protein